MSVAEKRRECPSCALEVPARAEACPYCGYEFPSNRAGFSPAAWLMVLILAAWPLYKLFQLLL